MTMRWGIFGTGAVSAKFAAGLKHARAARVEAVFSRSAQSGRSFADAFGAGRVVEGYVPAQAASAIDVAYIATPPSEHAAHAIACLEAGIPVLVEKPFARSEGEARRIADAARSAGLFCMEAMWTRFNPAAQRLKAIVDAGKLGEIRAIHGEFCFSNIVDPDSSTFDSARGGGAMAQLGIYPLSLACWLFGAPETVHATGRIGSTGVDEDAAIMLRFAGGRSATLAASVRSASANRFCVRGTHGRAEFIGPIFRPSGIRIAGCMPRGRSTAPDRHIARKALLRESGLAQRLAQLAGFVRTGGRVERHLFAGNGYHYQADEVARCIAAGLKESPVMPLDETVAIIALADQIRRQIAEGCPK